MSTTLSNKQIALEYYLERDFVLFPLNGKIPPAGFHWREATFDPFFEPKNNFGVQLSDTDLVIDIDPRNGGNESFKKLTELAVAIPPTFTVITGSGGKHLYYKKPAEFKVRKNLKEYPGIDFISTGGYVVACGSIHPDTKKEYCGVGMMIADAPTDILELIKKQDIQLVKPTGMGTYDDSRETVQRFSQYLQKAPIAIEGQSGDSVTFTVAATGRDFGLSPDRTFSIILDNYNDLCLPPWAPDELRRKVENAYKYASGEIGNQNPVVAFKKENAQEWTPEQDKFFHRSDGKIKLDQHNVALMFAPTFPLEGLLAMDLFSHQIVYKRPAPWHTKYDKDIKIWNDDEAARARHWLSTNKKFEPTQNLMHDGALAAAYQYQFHPVKEYFESLSWDGHKRVHNWMHKILGAIDDQYTRAVGLKTLVACVKRVYEPGCKFDYITVLEGPQRTGKSTAWKILAGEQWFGDSAIDITKEWSIMKTFGKLMYEWAEMETFRRGNTQAMKSYLSSACDTVRLPYNRTSRDIPRSGIFVGSFNPEADKDIGWLHDTTGNSRYWVIETGVTGSIDNDGLRQIRDQLWAEAIELYRAGTPIYFEDAKVIQQAQEEQAKRLGKDPWTDAIDVWLCARHNLDRTVLTGGEIFTDCIGGRMVDFKRGEMVRIARVMQELGWRKGTHFHPERKENVSGYRRPELQ